ncbi:esterase/lipase family protein [Marinobacter caseinilyticus]|uniref:esterase/lipase family protein n=1 Tax=Marinobacter caseinilyticus TaxID=2692195 RepID=UPI001F18998C|nr:alpha/beta fold hydrolase [Marinobacter caseinilyticus]
MPNNVRAPSKALFITEPSRSMTEFGLLPLGLPLILAAPRGDGHPVMVFPGMAASDLSTITLRTVLANKGYRVYGWDQGRNYGSEELMDPLLSRLSWIRQKHGATVSLVGWSLGGIYARELAKLAPHDVRCVVTLGSPFKGPSKASNVWRIYEILSRNKVQDDADPRFSVTPPVPTTAIFSRSDGIVAWQSCAEKPGPKVESIEVVGSHVGLGHNALSLYAIADRLAQPEHSWAPFSPRGVRRWLYRNPWRDGESRNAVEGQV